MPPATTTTRSRFDVRVGSMHTLEVLLQIRSTDISWWETHRRENERELYKLIGRRILPEELDVEIQSDLTREGGNSRLKTVSGEVLVGKKKVVVGEVNLKKMAKNTGKNKRGNSTTKGGTMSKAKKAKTEHCKSSKQQSTSTSSANKQDTNDVVDKRPKLLRETGKWVMGKSIQACYVMEDIDSTASCSMAFRPIKKQPMKEQNNSDSKDIETITSPTQQDADGSTITDQEESTKMIPLSTFRSWNKLSKRLNIWVFQFDADNPTDLSVSEDGGFPRPDLLPLADIFR